MDSVDKKTMIFLLAILIIFLGQHYWEENIDNTYNCLRYNTADGNFQSAEVTIKGVYKRSLFKKDTLKFKLFIDGEMYPDLKLNDAIIPYGFRGVIASDGEIAFEGSDVIEDEIKKHNDIRFVDLQYANWDYYTKRYYFGSLSFDKDMKNITLFLDNKDKKYAGEVVFDNELFGSNNK